jgi:hypothetical protein
LKSLITSENSWSRNNQKKNKCYHSIVKDWLTFPKALRTESRDWEEYSSLRMSSRVFSW